MTSRELKEIKAEIDKKIDEYNKVLVNEDSSATLSRIEEELRYTEREYLRVKECEVWRELHTHEAPFLEAVQRLTFVTETHKAIRENGKLIMLEESQKDVFIDMTGYCKFYNESLDWWYTLEKFNQLLCMRVATEIGATHQLESIQNSFWMSRVACDIELGKTPLSNNQLARMLQKVFDGMVYIPTDSGKEKV